MSPISDSARELLLNGISSAKDGDNERAKFYLEWVLRESCTQDQRIKALYYLGKVAETRKEKLEWIEQLLIEDPTHPEARRELAILRGQISAAGIPDPNVRPTPPPTAPLARRKTNCDKCGGKLVFSPDGKSLDCERCGIRYPFATQPDGQTDAPAVANLTPPENDFVVQLAQTKGHVAPAVVRNFICPTCGASFALAEAALSLNCPYCGTGFVPEANPRDWIAPHSVMPFRITKDAAWKTYRAWWLSSEMACADTMREIYLPVWDFDFSGSMQVTMSDGSGVTLAEWAVEYGHILVPGTHTMPAPVLSLLRQIEFSAAAHYQPALLANRLTEMYTVAPADASLAARESVIRREAATHFIPPNGFLNPAKLSASTCNLLLIPFWVARWLDKRTYIHGQSGEIAGDQ